jgi:hypothetical protein
MIQVRLFCEHINDDKTYSLGLTYMTRNDGYGALISHIFSNIKSLKIMKSKKNPKKTKSNFRVKIWRKKWQKLFFVIEKIGSYLSKGFI